MCLIIFIYGNYRCNNPEYRDHLMKKLGYFDLDGWSISHFLFFLFLSYKFPNEKYFIGLLGILWEFFEHYLGKKRPGWLGGFGDCATTDPNIDEWWYGRISDIIVNTFGIIVGSTLLNNK